MPEQRETFVLNRSFSDEEMNALRRGNIPQAMEDKWFCFMDMLFALTPADWNVRSSLNLQIIPLCKI